MKKELKDKVERKRSKKNKTKKSRGGCNCGNGKGLFFGGGDIANNPFGDTVWLPKGSYYSLNNYNNDPSGLSDIIGSRNLSQASVTPVLIGGKLVQKTKKNRVKGGGFFNDFTDFLLGPSSAFAPVTSFGTTAGTVSDANTLFGNRGYVNGMPYSQPIGYKFNSHNLPMV